MLFSPGCRSSWILGRVSSKRTYAGLLACSSWEPKTEDKMETARWRSIYPTITTCTGDVSALSTGGCSSRSGAEPSMAHVAPADISSSSPWQLAPLLSGRRNASLRSRQPLEARYIQVLTIVDRHSVTADVWASQNLCSLPSEWWGYLDIINKCK